MDGFRIIKGEELTDTFRRVSREQILLSVDFCRNSNHEPDVATHEIRKCTKRIRAIYRLYREVTGETSYKLGQENLRNISNLLSLHRAAKVHIDIISRLGSRRLPVDRNHLNRLLEVLQERHMKLTGNMVEKENVFHQADEMLHDELARMDDLPLRSCDFPLLAQGIKNTFVSGRKDLEVVMDRYSAENLHALRKTVKCLWNQLILVRPVWPAQIGMTVHFLDMLAEKLGYDHDLDDLCIFLIRERDTNNLSVPLHLMEYLNAKRKLLKKTIKLQALRIFSERPGSLKQKLETYYRLFDDKPLKN
jgi:CHAD domain-containing protein